MASQSTAGLGPATTESTHKRVPDDDLSLDEVFGVLSNQRRRLALRYLIDESDARSATLGELADHIASVENGKSLRSVSSNERKRVYVGLLQTHLPKMDRVGVIEFDEDRKTVEIDAAAEYVVGFLPESPAGGPPRRRASLTDAVTRVTDVVGEGLAHWR